MQDDRDAEHVMLGEARADVAMADHKASMVLASLGIGFAALLGGLFAGDWDPADLAPAGEFFWWIGASMAAASVASAAAAVWPRFSTGDVSRGITYWGHVATFDSVEKLDEALEHDQPSLRNRTRQQLWQISRIVDRKYRLVRLAIALAGIAATVLLLSIAMG